VIILIRLMIRSLIDIVKNYFHYFLRDNGSSVFSYIGIFEIFTVRVQSWVFIATFKIIVNCSDV